MDRSEFDTHKVTIKTYLRKGLCFDISYLKIYYG